MRPPAYLASYAGLARLASTEGLKELLRTLPHQAVEQRAAIRAELADRRSRGGGENGEHD